MTECEFGITGYDALRMFDQLRPSTSARITDHVSCLKQSRECRVVGQRRIGASYVTTRFFDADGDDQDDAIVILKIETTGSAIPQIVYIYSYKNEKPELIWYFRTGDRADGGLKDLRPENGQFVVELFGQDRFLMGETETAKITNDYEQICCPTFYTRSIYKWNGKSFQPQGKRLTFSMADPNAAPVENMAEVVEKQLKSGKR